MDNITPEDVAKGMFDYMVKQGDCVLIKRDDFMKICTEVASEMDENDSYKDALAPIKMLLLLDRAHFMLELRERLFKEDETSGN